MCNVAIKEINSTMYYVFIIYIYIAGAAHLL